MTTSARFRVEGMSCAHCQAAVTKALQAVAGVVAARVDLQKAQAEVTYESERVVFADLAKAVEEAGYTLLPA